MTTDRILNGRKLIPTMDELLLKIDEALEDSYANETSVISNRFSNGTQTKED